MTIKYPIIKLFYLLSGSFIVLNNSIKLANKIVIQGSPCERLARDPHALDDIYIYIYINVN